MGGQDRGDLDGQRRQRQAGQRRGRNRQRRQCRQRQATGRRSAAAPAAGCRAAGSPVGPGPAVGACPGWVGPFGVSGVAPGTADGPAPGAAGDGVRCAAMSCRSSLIWSVSRVLSAPLGSLPTSAVAMSSWWPASSNWSAAIAARAREMACSALRVSACCGYMTLVSGHSGLSGPACLAPAARPPKTRMAAAMPVSSFEYRRRRGAARSGGSCGPRAAHRRGAGRRRACWSRSARQACSIPASSSPSGAGSPRPSASSRASSAAIWDRSVVAGHAALTSPNSSPAIDRSRARARDWATRTAAAERPTTSPTSSAERPDGHPQQHDLPLCLGKPFEEPGEPAREVGADRLLLGSGRRVRLLDHMLHRRDDRVADRGALRVGDLVRGDAVHEGGEGPTLVTVLGQRAQQGQTDLLGNIVGGRVAATHPAQPGPAVADQARAGPASSRVAVASGSRRTARRTRS